MRKTTSLFAGVFACLTVLAPPVSAGGKPFTIFHTNDIHSRFIGFGPDNEYTPATLNNDKTQGGMARLAALLEQRRAQVSDATLVLDGGDFSMGTMFQLISRKTGAELQFFSEMNYDAVTLGNHEFDFRSQGLAEMISSAAKAKGDSLVPIVISNLSLPKQAKELDSLRAHVDSGKIKDYLIIEKDGLRFGVFGLLGYSAIEVSPMAKPAEFADPIQRSREMVAKLRNLGVDVVIALSHSGLAQQADGSWKGEDVTLAEQVPGIDIIISGHSHTAVAQPIVKANGTIIVQAGSETRYLGELHARVEGGGRVMLDRYELIPVDDTILGDKKVTKMVDGFAVEASEYLASAGLKADQPVAKVDRTLTPAFEDAALGNLVADSIRHATQADIAFTGNGTIRDNLTKGETGIQSVSDLFRISPLGVGHYDDATGYPLTKAYYTGRELKNIFEVTVYAYQNRDENYFPRISGARFTYNPYRMPFDQISNLEIGDDVNGYTKIDLSSDRLYSIGATSYVAGFAWLIPALTKGIVTAVPKDSSGKPLPNVESAIIDADPSTPGIQEQKEWRGFIDYVLTLPKDEGGLAVIDSRGSLGQSRMIRQPSLMPTDLFRNASFVQWGAAAAIILLIGGVTIPLMKIYRTVTRKRIKNSPIRA